MVRGRLPVVIAGLATIALVVVGLALAGRWPAGPGGPGIGSAPSGDPTASTSPPTVTVAPSPTLSPSPAATPVPTATPSATATVVTPAPSAPDTTGSLDLSASYDVDLALDYGNRRLDVDATINIANTSGPRVDRLVLNTVAARLGNLRLDVATVGGAPVEVEIHDQTLLVPIPGGLESGASATVRIAFRSTLRSGTGGSDWLFTRANGIIDAYRWLPWLSRDVPFDRPNHGDPFVTAVSPRVVVRITTDRPMVLATTGERIGAPSGAGGLAQTFGARNVRDFTVTASPTYRELTGASLDGDTTITVYTLAGEPAAAILGAARRALAGFEALVGPYPYPTLAIAQSAGGLGMEGPAIVWIPGDVASTNLDYLVHHEIAHQWFYALVGNDQAAQPFADEAATDFLARRVLGSRRASRCDTTRLDRDITSYSSACYYEIVYIQGGNFLDDLRKRMGSTAFFAGLNAYIDAHRFELGSTRALLEALDAATPDDLRPAYAARFPGL